MKSTIIYLLLLLTFTGQAQTTDTTFAGEAVIGLSIKDYTSNALSIMPDGSVLQKPETIIKHWQTVFKDDAFATSQLLIYVGLKSEAEYSYEISRWETIQGERFAQLIVWDNRGDKPLRALEFIASYDKPVEDLSSITASRELWMEHCNAHAIDRLIEEVYTSNTLYYNHRPLLRGRDALLEEYAYMKRPDYRLRLTPVYLEPVTEKLAFEIGQCSGSYGGKYIIVWEQNAEGNWQVLLDANL